MKIFYTAVFLFGICMGQNQHSTLFGRMLNIPAKIHSEIFGGIPSRSLPLIDLSNFNSRRYIAMPLLPQKRSPDMGLNFNSIAYGLGPYQIPQSNISKTMDRIPLATELFAPAIIKYPAATKGQIEAYMKALEQEMKEAQKEMQMLPVVQDAKKIQNVDSKAVSYVSVRLGGTQNVNYHYTSI